MDSIVNTTCFYEYYTLSFSGGDRVGKMCYFRLTLLKKGATNMARKDYLEVKALFTRFTEAWRAREFEAAEGLFADDAACSLSVFPGESSLEGIRRLFESTPKLPLFRLDTANEAIFIKGEQGRQSAYFLAALSGADREAPAVFEFQAICTLTYRKGGDGWKISHLRLAVCDPHGEGVAADEWYHEDRMGWYPDAHMPNILGELDSPWLLQEEESGREAGEEVMLPFYRYAFALDTLSFGDMERALSDELEVEMEPYGRMDKRLFMSTLKSQRQTGIDWVHPGKPVSIKIQGSRAQLVLHRVGGHGRRAIPVSADNIGLSYIDGIYHIEMELGEDGWRIRRLSYSYEPQILHGNGGCDTACKEW